MLYVFQVDSGSMMTFDMNLALESVGNLKEAIWIQYRIPLDRQVLLVSGGECLNSSERVCNYHAGTDTNPIFLFNKLHIESAPPSGQVNTNQIHVNYGSNDNLTDIDSIKDQVEGCLSLPPTYMTVVSRCQLAQQLYDLGKEFLRKCEQLTHDQHLQHQGWAAVVGNLEDIIISFKKRIDLFQLTYSIHIGEKAEQLKLLEGFEQDLNVLQNVDVVPSLVDGQSLTLYGWVESKDTTNPLRQFAHTCLKAVESLDPKVIETLEREATAVVDKGSQTSMKEIKGLEERLFGLDQLLIEARKLVQEQYELLQAFIQNQNRASDLKDSSILPDLCQSHQHQLLVMLRNHQQLDDIRRRCQKAKEELSVNLNARLKWVMYVQKSLLDTSNKLTMYLERLKRIKLQIQIMFQIHNAPNIYCEAVVEVVRRKQFTSMFLEWAGDLASKMDQIYKTETQRRREFGNKFECHFLRDLFQGLDDFPKPFANLKPDPFDAHLPDVVNEDVEKLKQKFSWIETETEPSLDLPTSTRSDESSRSNLEMENVQLKLEVETTQSELFAKDEEMAKVLTSKEDQIQKIELELKLKDEAIARERRVVEEKSKEVEGIKEKLRMLECTLESNRSESESKLTLVVEKHCQILTEVENKHREEITKLTEQFRDEKEEGMKMVKDNCKREVDGLKARFKFMTSIEQKSPVDSIERTMDPYERLPKCDELLAELGRVVDAIQRSVPEGLSPYSVRKILRKLEGPPATIASSPGSRTRNVSDGGLRSSLEMDEDQNTVNTRSVYGLDTSAIEATSMLTSSCSDPALKDLTEVLMPSQKIVNAASKLVQRDVVTIQSCKPGDKVFIYWNEKLNSYVIYLNIKNVHFLHTDCLKMINNSDTTAEGLLGVVQDKEYCVARRAQNRYRVPQGFHFYRVKVAAVEILNLSSKTVI